MVNVIYIYGGEPSTHPQFFELARMLSNKHILEICTNLSWNVEKLIADLSPERLKIAPTFHYEFADFETFFNKVLLISKYLSDNQVLYVVHPEGIGEVEEHTARFKNYGLKLIPLAIRGEGGLLISEEIREKIRNVSPYSGKRLEYQLKEILPKGKLCRAGQHYAVIRGDGSVDRCSQYTNGSLGNFFNEDFRLLARPFPCELEYCPIESQWIVE